MKNLIPDFIAERYSQNDFNGNFFAKTLFLDISGFTSMTERLMLEGKEGAEILSIIINKIFEPVIQSIYNHNGFVATFGGDAFTAIFTQEDSALESACCALEILQIFKDIGKQQTKFGLFDLKVKIGLSAGAVEYRLIDNQNQMSYFFRGEAINNCAEAEHRAQVSQIVADGNFIKELSDNSVEYITIDSSFYRITASSQADSPNNSVKGESITKEILREFIPDQVLSLNQDGEFRDAVSIFISFKEFAESTDVNLLIKKTIFKANSFGGYFNRVSFGDKGGMMLVLFGMPRSYENNLVRALDFSLELQQEYKEIIRIGLNSGTAYAGFIGSSIIAEYTAYGDIVNQAARFMSATNWGAIWLSEKTAHKVDGLYKFSDLGKMNFKGKSEAIAVYELIGKNDNLELSYFSGEMIGRKAELSALTGFAEPLKSGKFAGIFSVFAEAGMGKSRLIFEFVKNKDAVETLFLQSDSVLKMSLNPFKYLLHNYFNQNKAVNSEEKKNNFEAVFNLLLLILNKSLDERTIQIINELVRTKSILAAQVEVYYENSLYEQLDAKTRFDNTIYAYKEFFKALALFKPVIIQLEDIHWLDDDSHKLIQILCRAIEDYPILIIATSRLNDDGTQPALKVDPDIRQQVILLNKFGQDCATDFINIQLEGKADPQLITLISTKAEFNPFFIEQTILYLKENNLLIKNNDHFTLKSDQIAIPESVNALIISRIDRLAGELKEIVQLASVFGREVELKVLLLMIDLYQSNLNRAQIGELLEKIEDEQLWHKFAEIKYIFKHALLNEAAYEMQLKSRLRELHRLAAMSIEQLHLNDEDKFYELATHYDKAEILDKAIVYYEQAGKWLKKSYQNKKAIECFDWLSTHLDLKNDPDKFYDAVYSQCTLLNIIGSWDKERVLLEKSITDLIQLNLYNFLLNFQRNYIELLTSLSDFEKALQITDEMFVLSNRLDNQYNKLLSIALEAKILMLKCNYSEAIIKFESTISPCLNSDYKDILSLAYSGIGISYWSQGDYTSAIKYYELGLRNCEELGDLKAVGDIVGNLGIVYKNQGNLSKAMECYDRQYQICRDFGYKHGIGIVCGNIGIIYKVQGNYEKAMTYYQIKKSVCEELGDRRGLGVVMNNIGSLYGMQLRYSEAVTAFQVYRRTCLELGDNRGLSMSLFNIGNAYENESDFTNALDYYNRAIELAKSINNNHYLCIYLECKASLLFSLDKWPESEACNIEAYEVAQKVGAKEIIFDSLILTQKLCSLNERDKAITGLTNMIDSETDEENRARIHYEIYKINHSTEHGLKALQIYQTLYSTVQDIMYKKAIDELSVLI